MIAVDGTLAAFMESSNRAVRVDLYTFTLSTNAVLRWTGGDTPVLVPDGRLFKTGPLITRSKLKSVAGIEVDELEVNLTPRPTDVVAGVPLMQLAMLGGLRGCTVLLEWAYFDEQLAFKGLMPKFFGSGSPSGFEGGTIDMQVKSELERLLIMMPRDVYQPPCLNTVYDAGCGANRTSKTVTGAVTSVVTGSRSSFTSGRGEAAGYFNQGVVRFDTGANQGHQRTVRSFASGAFDFALPFPFAIVNGDTFSAWPGCDRSKTGANGCPKFFPTTAEVQKHFRGQPFVPAPEVAT